MDDFDFLISRVFSFMPVSKKKKNVSRKSCVDFFRKM